MDLFTLTIKQNNLYTKMFLLPWNFSEEIFMNDLKILFIAYAKRKKKVY